MIEFRKANLADANELARIRSIFILEANGESSEEIRVQLEAANNIYFKTSLADDSFVAWLGIDGQRIIATSGLSFSLIPPSFSSPDGKAAYIMNMFTLPDYRRLGIGTELFKRIVEEAKTRGYKKITLNATKMGRPLYERYGFKDSSGDMVFYIEGL